jgi:gamma-glutamyltranspeptidase/glutathione hydrolase
VPAPTMKSMIVAAQPEAAEAGARVLQRGGNAVDAGIAAALVQCVVDPQMCGIAGFGNAQIRQADGTSSCIDFHGKTPLAAAPAMWEHLLDGETRDGFGFILKGNVNDMGYGAITTPGSLMAYYEAANKFGSWNWADLCAPAIAQAEAGFIVRPHVAFWWNAVGQLGRADNIERQAFSKTGREIYFSAPSKLKTVGERVENPDFARTLKLIAKHGADVFYRGEIAERIEADMIANGGLIRKADLEAYRTQHSPPLMSTYRDYDISTCQPPGGGIMLTQMLNILENFPLSELGHNSTEYIRVVAEAMKATTSDKNDHVGDPAFVDIPAHLTEKSYAADIAQRIRAGERIAVERIPLGESPDTTHVAVVDRNGMAFTMTHSLGMPSGVISDGLGFMYNGCMGVFDPRPGRAGSIAPGKSRFSALCPAIASKDGEPRIVIGAPGGAQIAMGVLQGLLNVIDFDMTMQEAVSAPRFSSTSNAIDIMNRIPDYVVEPLAEEGYEIIRSPLTFGIGAVHGIRIDGGKLTGGADPGHDGVALAV